MPQKILLKFSKKEKKGENMDKYTKGVLTVIAVGIIGINLQMLGDKIITNAEAYSDEVTKVAICNTDGRTCAWVTGNEALTVDTR